MRIGDLGVAQMNPGSCTLLVVRKFELDDSRTELLKDLKRLTHGCRHLGINIFFAEFHVEPDRFSR